MSDECLMKQETVFSFYVVYQAVMRKFTLAGKAIACLPKKHYLCIEMSWKGLISRMSDECRKDVRWKKEDGRCCYPHPITPLIPYH